MNYMIFNNKFEKSIVFLAVFLALFCSCIGGPVCNKPYILVGAKCCLDRNNNRICDKDEVEEVKTTMTFVTSTSATSPMTTPQKTKIITTTYITTTYTNTIPFKTEGILLVRKNSKVEKIAREIANKRAWVFLSVENPKPEKIRDEIKKIVNNRSTVKYLFIIGSDEQIPLVDRWKLIKFEPYYPDKPNVGAVLDSVFYGNVDEDSFVELGVGRIPFDSEEEVREYIDNLEVKGSKNYFFYYPIYEEVDVWTLSQGVCLSKEFRDTNYHLEAKKGDVIRFFDDAKLFVINSHGGTDSWSLDDGSFSIEDIPNLSQTRPIVISDVCLAAQVLGPEFLRNNAGAFIGQYFVTGDYGVQRTFILSKKILHGKNLGDVMREYLNYAIAKSTIYNKIPPSSKDTIVNLNVDNYESGDHDVILFGDPTLAIPQSASVIPKVTIMKKDNLVEIIIPKPITETIKEPKGDNYVVECFGGDSEIEKWAIWKKHWDIMKETPEYYSRMTDFIFSIESVDEIGSGKEIIDNKEFKFKIGTKPVISLVKGNTERYLVIVETFLDPSQLANGRKIIFEVR